MAITRRFLSALGIEADKIDEIITAHLETVNELKEARDKYKVDADKLPGVQKQLEAAQSSASDEDSYKTKYENLQTEFDTYKTKYENLQTEFDTYKTNVEAEKANAEKKAQYRDLLRECGIPEKRLDAVLRLVDLDKVEVDADGKIDGVEDVKKAIKADWADYIPADENHGANVPDPPAGGNGGNRAPSRAAMVAQKHYEAIYGKQKEGAK